MNIPCQLPVMFDPNTGLIHAGGGDFIKVSGKYPVVIVECEMKQTKNNQAAHYLQFTLEILDGDLKGQRFVDRLNINNPSEQTREIAYKSLTSYATAVGYNQAFADASVLKGRPFMLFVNAEEKPSTTDPNKTNWENSVKKWYYADGEEIQQGKFGSAKAQGTPPTGQYAAPSAAAPAAAPAPQAAPAAPQQQYAAPVATAPAQQQYAPPVQQAPAQQQYAPPVQQAPAQQQYAPPAGAAPAQGSYVPPAAPAFTAPQ